MAVIVWYMLKEKKNQSHNENFFLPLDSRGIVLNRPSDTQGLYQIKVRGEIWRANSMDHLELQDEVVVSSIDKEKLIATVKKVTKE